VTSATDARSCGGLERAAVEAYLHWRTCSGKATEAFRRWADTLPPEEERAWSRYQEAAEREAAASLRYCELVRALESRSRDSSHRTGTVLPSSLKATDRP
jgi:hypothetical protein